MSIANQRQFEAWNGAEGAAWAAAARAGGDRGRIREIFERLIELAAIGPADRVLDIGCGAGESTRLAARHAIAGQVTGVDLSVPQIEQAVRATATAGLGNVSYTHADVQVHPFDPGAFDVAISMHGVMFFADPVAAFANIGRALTPGGRLALVCPQPAEDCAWYVVPIAALLGLPPHPEEVIARYPGDPPAMFSLSAPGRLREVLTETGFVRISVEAARMPMPFGPTAAESAVTLLSHGPTRYLLERSDTLTWDEARTRLETALAPYETPAGVRVPGAQWLVTARRPAPT
ncbi:methyltransferase [Sphaerisporangium rufum]|uniref:Methyltransferase n=1 Tax=Sphaerisporangium rufum TaxID=1381558 RepID=A0A919R451_9ACTN|nr:class I SAM-dependent methyltransferase [Sphaerisporangium rufum]GII78061.1 methyltransferase [Sphaerisporangium rufum]